MVLKDFYLVESSTEVDGKYITQLNINKDHQVYQGHFPGRPVTPGVILMNLFKEDTERRFNCELNFKTASNVKFLSVVDPTKDNILFLEYEIESENDVLKLKGIAKNTAGISLKINSIYLKK